MKAQRNVFLQFFREKAVFFDFPKSKPQKGAFFKIKEVNKI